MTNALVPISDIKVMAEQVSKSGCMGFKKTEDAITVMLMAAAEGYHPMIGIRDYHLIQGKPALKADAMLARFQQSGGKVKWLKLSDTEVEAVFSHASGGDATISWDMKRAKQAQLGSNGMWGKYPRQMLRARVISEGIRTVFPGVIVGSYTPEEVQDFEGTTIEATASVVETKPDFSMTSPDGMSLDEKKKLYAEAEEVLEVVTDTGELASWRDQYDKKLRTNISAARMKILDEKAFAIQQTLEAKERVK